MNHITPRHRLPSKITSKITSERGQALPKRQDQRQDHVDISAATARRDVALDLVLSEALSDQTSGVKSLYELAALGDFEAAHLLSEIALSSREVVAHLSLDADRLFEWAAELGHPRARFYFAMRRFDGSEEEQSLGLASLIELAQEGFREAIDFMRSMSVAR